MDQGRLIACDTPEGLVRGLGMAAKVQAEITEGALPPETLAALPGVTGDASEDGHLELQTTNVQQTLVALLELATRHGVTLTDLSSTRATLEDVFLSLTGRHYVDQEAPGDKERTNG